MSDDPFILQGHIPDLAWKLPYVDFSEPVASSLTFKILTWIYEKIHVMNFVFPINY